eukprot:14361841-Alexandrium_andersonii.AAC.1
MATNCPRCHRSIPGASGGASDGQHAHGLEPRIPQLKEWAMGPGKDSGHYSRHLKAKLGSGAFQKGPYELEVPGHSAQQLARCPVKFM